MHKILHIIEHSILDALKLIPFLFISFIIMELIEHKLNNKRKLTKANKFGPFAGATLGIIPQCGFSVVASTLYSARVITLGTLFSIYLSTSDEMLPILIANKSSINVIVEILFTKFVLGLLFGIIVDIVYKTKLKNNINEICNNDECHCKDGIIKSSLIHTIKIIFFIILINIIINLIIDKNTLSAFTNNSKILSPIFASIIGLIPNCASSVLITQLYLSEVISFGTMMTGLLVGAGVGILILLRVAEDKKDALRIIGLLYVIGVVS